MSRARGRKAGKQPEQAGLLPFFEAFFTHIDVGLCFLNRELQVVAVNEAMRRLVPGRDFTAPGPCLQPEPAMELCARCPALEVLQTGVPATRRVVETTAEGVERHLEAVCHPLVDAAGVLFGVAQSVRDISRRDTAEREMALATRDIEMLLASIRSILVSLDGQNRIRRFNAGAEAAFGLSAAAVTGRDFFDVGLDWDGHMVRAAVEESRRSLAPVRVDEVRCRTPGNEERLLGLTANPVPAPGGDSPGVLLLGQDLAEIKARELKAAHERRMQAIGHLAAGIAHEINTPVQYVGYNAGFLDEAFTDVLALLGAYDGLAGAVRNGDAEAMAQAAAEVGRLAREVDIEYLRQEIPSAIANTRKGIGQVADIVRAMRQMSHPGTGERLFFDINASVRDIVTITRNAWKHVADVSLELSPELPMVYGLPHEVSQVLLNVVLNAAQAVEERVGREPWVRGRIVIASRLTPEHLEIAVTDNGPGIDQAARGRVFDPFFTTKAVGKGTGQGLAISHAVMTRHGGGIDFTTRLGEGTTFFVRFPLEDGGQAQPGAS
ncbi:Signal transduction histidine kinase HoxJ (hydrogenase regulation) [Desulfovibrio sp. DV]|uniref:ATP-binding protein n=1 Tax=Desulfovibrio sp. DV TaxID=1844708 RepID=UPI00094BA369|nr:ATP-binding protein [Desulfovibrio sp. DV]OLN27366.1 Signal transduction histidine kinase HoxJ (hydrogenase regulation) [Desulfovibrio sp. DV]